MSKLLNKLDRVQEQEYKDLSKEVDNLEKKVSQEVLLLGAHDEEFEALKKAGLTNRIKYENKLANEYREIQKKKEDFNKSSYSGKQIKKLCNLYNLRLLPANEYNGKIPTELGNILIEFAEANDINISSENFYILAPTEMFGKIENIGKNPVDPILFYKETDRNTSRQDSAREYDVFTEIHSWGYNFSRWRKYHVLVYGDNSSNVLGSVIITILILAIALFSPLGFFLNLILIIINSLTLLSIGFDKFNNSWNKSHP